MSDLHPDLIEPWSYPIPHLVEHAQVWHARRFATWLLSAGAEPRFGTLLTSGMRALTRWMLLLEEQGVEIMSTASTLERPLPAPLTAHRGTHFNRKLFLVEGLDQIAHTASLEEREAHWRTLEGQRGQLRQTATWVVLLITHPQTIADMIRWAPRLIQSVDRVCWMWEASERSSSAEPIEVPRLVRHDLIYQLFSASASSAHPVDHFTLGRIFRCGYPNPARSAHQRWKWGYRLWRGEARDPNAARFGQIGVTETLRAEVSAEDALWALRGRAQAASPARVAQWRERARDARDAWLLNPTISITAKLLTRAAYDERSLNKDETLKAPVNELDSLRAWRLNDVSTPLPRPEALSLIEDWVSSAQTRLALGDLARATVTEWLTHAFAAHEDLERCLSVNQALYRDSDAWPESRFSAAERSIDLALFSSDHAEARRLVELLAELDLELASPHFAARYLNAKAKQLGALDPSRGVWEREEASRLEERFGLRAP